MKKRSLKASFVVTFAGSAAALAAPCCFSSVSTNSTNPQEITCPDVAPNSGEACTTPGLACSYSDLCGGPEVKCSDDGVWSVEYTVSCNPPEVLVCPATIP